MRCSYKNIIFINKTLASLLGSLGLCQRHGNPIPKGLLRKDWFVFQKVNGKSESSQISSTFQGWCPNQYFLLQVTKTVSIFSSSR